MANQQTVQIAGSQAIIAPAGQFLRAQNVVQATNLLQNANILSAAAGQNVVRTATGLQQQLLQFPFQQTIPVQIPIATSNGQTIIQTVHIPIQTVATAMPNTSGQLIQTANGQFQIIQQPQQLQLPQQLAQVITPNGQIQLAQIQPAQTKATQAGIQISPKMQTEQLQYRLPMSIMIPPAVPPHKFPQPPKLQMKTTTFRL